MDYSGQELQKNDSFWVLVEILVGFWQFSAVKKGTSAFCQRLPWVFLDAVLLWCPESQFFAAEVKQRRVWAEFAVFPSFCESQTWDLLNYHPKKASSALCRRHLTKRAPIDKLLKICQFLSKRSTENKLRENSRPQLSLIGRLSGACRATVGRLFWGLWAIVFGEWATVF